MGGRMWDAALPAMEARGHCGFASTLTDEHACDLTASIYLVSALIGGHELADVVLVAHCHGGMVITGVADRFADRIRHLLHIDAAVPEPGRSRFDIIACGGRAPVSLELPRPARLRAARAPPRHCISVTSVR